MCCVDRLKPPSEVVNRLPSGASFVDEGGHYDWRARLPYLGSAPTLDDINDRYLSVTVDQIEERLQGDATAVPLVSMIAWLALRLHSQSLRYRGGGSVSGVRARALPLHQSSKQIERFGRPEATSEKKAADRPKFPAFTFSVTKKRQRKPLILLAISARSSKEKGKALTRWWWTQSRANPSLPLFPISGKFSVNPGFSSSPKPE